MHRSLTDRIEVRRHLNGTFSATQTPADGVDTKGLRNAEVMIDIGAVPNIANVPQPSWSFALQHSDSVNANFEAVSEGDVALPDGATLSGGGVFAIVDAAAKDDAIFRVGYVGIRRYVRVVATATNTPGSTPIAALVVGEKLLSAPAA